MKPIIAGNWKMNKTIDEGLSFVNEVKNRILDKNDAKVIFCPPFTSLFSIARLLDNSTFCLGAQNVHSEIEGAYTGEISVQILKSADVEYVILGHSERRKYFGETDKFIKRKIDAVLKGGLKPIVCVGETLDERNSGQTKEVLKKQIENGFNNLEGISRENLILAYEPIWAIGTGRTCEAEEANRICSLIRKWSDSADLIIQYGGSVKPNNIDEIMSMPDIDGVLVGGASLDPESFARIANYKI